MTINNVNSDVSQNPLPNRITGSLGTMSEINALLQGRLGTSFNIPAPALQPALNLLNRNVTIRKHPREDSESNDVSTKVARSQQENLVSEVFLSMESAKPLTANEIEEAFLKIGEPSEDEINMTLPFASVEDQTTETISVEGAPNANLNSEQLDLPRKALEAVMLSERGLSKSELLSYFLENNKEQIHDNKSYSIFNDFKTFPDYYEPPLPYTWNGSSCKATNIYVIGIILERIMQSSNSQDIELIALIKDMTKPVPSKIPVRKYIARFKEIQGRLSQTIRDPNDLELQKMQMLEKPHDFIPNNPIIQSIVERIKRDAAAEPQRTTTVHEPEDLDPPTQSFLEVCPGLSLSQRIEFNIAVLEEIKKASEKNFGHGMPPKSLYRILPENVFVKIESKKKKFYFGWNNRPLAWKYMPSDNPEINNWNYLSSNIWTAGSIIKTTIDGSENSPELDELITLSSFMMDREPRERPSLTTVLKTLREIHKTLVKQGK
ncbi:MAG TPA: hypothetical protein VLE96_03990 [Chlamydiales bacterium]|nr:hypothetical protein [Chlamydiales bacterium]